MIRPILIGQAPCAAHPNGPPFTGRTGARLRRLMGEDLFTRFDLATVFPSYLGRDASGDLFPMRQARARASAMVGDMEFTSRPAVVLCGHRVAQAFGLGDAAFFRRIVVDLSRSGTFHAPLPVRYYVIPHPAGTSRWWNRSDNVEAARDFFASLGRML